MQYQPLSYAKQLTLKEDVVRRAFANFSGLDPSLIPTIGSTLPSPLEYAYRTKLTPHFQTPPTGNPKGGRKRGKKGEEQSKALEEMNERLKEKEWEVTIGFEQKGRKRIVDIEECPIATRVINEAMVGEREKVKACVTVPFTALPFPFFLSASRDVVLSNFQLLAPSTDFFLPPLLLHNLSPSSARSSPPPP